MQLSISIVSYNTRAVLLKCIQSVFDQCRSISIEVIVVDNASSDGSVQAVRERFPNVHIIVNTTNRYFSAAHNQAFSQSRGDYFLILNSDVELKDNILNEMIEFLQKNPSYAGVGAQMYFSDSRLQNNCSKDYPVELAFYNFTLIGKLLRERARTLTNKVFYQDWDRCSSRNVEVIPDSFLMIRRSAFGSDEPLYDERFSLYFTENDLCLRLRNKGHLMWYLASGKTVHLEGQSVSTVNPRIISSIYRRDIFRYFLKYYGWIRALLLSISIEFTRCLIQLFKWLKLYRFKKNLVWGITD